VACNAIDSDRRILVSTASNAHGCCAVLRSVHAVLKQSRLNGVVCVWMLDHDVVTSSVP
jgi:hypothetical protein